NPYSPNASPPPRHAFPVRRPRCCFLYFTFLGINMMSCPCPLRFGAGTALSALRNAFALINPALHSDQSIGRMRLGRAVINIRAQRLQRQPPLQIPFLARDFGSVQPPGDAHLDPIASEPQR